MKFQFIFLSILLSCTSWAQETDKDGLFIKIGEATLRKSQTALVPFQNIGATAKSPSSASKELFNVVNNDLSVSSYFQMMSPSSFVESESASLRPKPQDANGFSFESWKQIGTEFLIKGGYRVTGNQLKFEGYVYYVPKSQNILAKSYEGPVSEVRRIGHKFANDIVEKLTGKKGMFLSKIVVTRSTTGLEKEIFLMDWDAENPQQVSHHHTTTVSPAFTRDDSSIYYTAFVLHKKTRRRNPDLFRYSVKSKKRDLVSYVPGLNSGVSFFSNSSNFVVRLSKEQNSDLYLMSSSGEILNRLTNGPAGALNVEPAISPDNSKIAFSSDRSGQPMVYVMNTDGSGVQRVTKVGKYNSTPAWTPDGKRIVFAANVGANFDLFIMDADGKNIVKLTSSKKRNGRPADNEYPTVSPDGRHIIFTSNRTGKSQLFVTDLEGQNERQLTFDQHNYFTPKWSNSLD